MTKSLPECPIATATILVGNKWKIQIMRELLIDQDNPKHFSDFKHNIIGISDKMLSKSLRDLEEDHIITREIIDSKPPRSIYKLTEIGLELADVLISLDQWGKKYQSIFDGKR